MRLTRRPFGTLPDGSAVTCWILENENLRAEILDHGATVRSLTVNGTDVVLGYDTLEEYLTNDGYLGATVGRVGNRIAGGRFSLHGREYILCKNDGENHLHGGKEGFDKKLWRVTPIENGVLCAYTSPDGEEGYPGTLQAQVAFTLEQWALCLHYRAVSDKDTPVSLTNHTYFNLEGGGTVLGHTLQVQADRYCPGDSGCLPTGALLPVEGTAMDFRAPHTIGERIESGEDCVRLSGGYDSNFCLCGAPAAVVTAPESGVTMTVLTDRPGVQVYSGNFLTERKGKNGAVYSRRSGLCLETQGYPDAVHHAHFPSCILRAGEVWESTTKYCFALR